MFDEELQAQIEAEKQQILEETEQEVELLEPNQEVVEEEVQYSNEEITSESGNKYRKFTEVVSTGINYVLYFLYAISIGVVLNLFTFITKGIVDMISRVADKIYEENEKYAKGEQEFNYKKFLCIAFAIFGFVVIAIVVSIYLFCRL